MTRQRIAVCVGLNYPGSGGQLAGCVNDAHDWAWALTGAGYDTRTLLEPTKAQLVAALATLVNNARYGDRIVFTFSGHGSWIPDRDGDEPDARDEVLCCADYRTGGLLVDDELLAIFGARRYGVRALILSDSCHSGTVSRFVGSPGGTARYLPPGEFLSDDDKARAVQVEGRPARGAPRKGAVLISGCADAEYSYDAWFDGRPNGAFSYWALRTLGQARNLRGWHAAIRGRLPNHTHPQSPQLTAAPHQRLWAPL